MAKLIKDFIEYMREDLGIPALVTTFHVPGSDHCLIHLNQTHPSPSIDYSVEHAKLEKLRDVQDDIYDTLSLLSRSMDLKDVYVEGFTRFTMPFLAIDILMAQYSKEKKITQAMKLGASRGLEIIRQHKAEIFSITQAAKEYCLKNDIPLYSKAASTNGISRTTFCHDILNEDESRIRSWPVQAYARLYAENMAEVHPAEGTVEYYFSDVVDLDKIGTNEKIRHIVFDAREKKTLEMTLYSTFPIVIFGSSHSFLRSVQCLNKKNGPKYSLIEMYPNSLY